MNNYHITEEDYALTPAAIAVLCVIALVGIAYYIMPLFH